MTFLEKLSSLEYKKYFFLFAIVISGIVIFHRLGEAPLAGDDCYYSGLAKQMVRTGDYLTIQNAFGPDFHSSKPPMLYWLNAVSGKIFGFNSFGMRFPSALLCFLGIVILLFFADRYFNSYVAFMSAIILTFTQQYLYHARSAVTDGPFAFFFTLALVCFWIARTENRNGFYYLMSIFAGFAVMTRQIPGLFIFAVILAYILFSKEYEILGNFHLYAALILAVAIIVPWHVVMYAKYGAMFLHQYFGNALSTGFYGYPISNPGNPTLNPWYAYFQILASNYEPWLIFLILGISGSVKKYFSGNPENRKKLIFIFCWVFVPCVIFQLAKVKQPHYLVPIYVPFALITAFAFDGFSAKIKAKITAGLIAVVLLLTCAYIAFPIIPKTLDSREYVKNMQFLKEAKSLEGDVYSVTEWSSYYSNFLWFYADKRLIKNTPEQIAEKINSDDKYNFILSKEVFEKLKSTFGRKAVIIRETEETVLFSNK